MSGLDYKEGVVFLDLVYAGSSGRLDYRVFGGGALFRTEADLIQDVQYSQAYPYDTVTVTGVPTTSVSDNSFGFDVGAGLDYRLGKSFAIGVQARYNRATAKLEPVAGDSVEVHAGGFQLGAGIRLIF